MYRPLMTVVGIVAMVLGVLILFAPRLYLSLYVPGYAPDMAFAAQRLAPAVIGLGALMWVVRDLPAGAVASKVSLIAALVWAGVAATGVFHYATGAASFNIVIAAASEVILALLFLVASRQMRTA